MSSKLPPQMHVFGPVDTPTPGFSPDTTEEPTWTPRPEAFYPEHYHQAAIDKQNNRELMKYLDGFEDWESDPRVQGSITDPVRPRDFSDPYECLSNIAELIKDLRLTHGETICEIRKHLKHFGL